MILYKENDFGMMIKELFHHDLSDGTYTSGERF
jgi:hypothetical protein